MLPELQKWLGTRDPKITQPGLQFLKDLTQEPRVSMAANPPMLTVSAIPRHAPVRTRPGHTSAKLNRKDYVREGRQPK